MTASDHEVLDDERLAMLAALVDGDVALASRLAASMLGRGAPLDEIIGDVLRPVQAVVGARWAQGDLGIAYEHAASAAVEELLVRLSATTGAATGPTVVVAGPELDPHALGARAVAAACTLDGFRVCYLGPSLPAPDLEDYLELQMPMALVLSCAVPTALASAARSIAAAHRLDVPVVGGGRAFGPSGRGLRLGLDALAGSTAEAVAVLRDWETEPPTALAPVPDPVPESELLAGRRVRLIATALDAAGDLGSRAVALGDEIGRVLDVTEGAVLLDEPAILTEHIGWLRATSAAHGVPGPVLDATLAALADALEADLPRPAATVRTACA
ncbi:MAG: B12-binding domain-containing protein [Actinomycetota bacterium]